MVDVILSVLADAVNPSLAVLVIAAVVKALLIAPRLAFRRLVATSLTLSVVYGERYLARDLAHWPSGSTFSTHTAFAIGGLALLVAWSRKRIRALALALALATFFIYAALMVGLGYHRSSDVATTAVTVIIPFGIGLLILQRLERRREGQFDAVPS